MPAAWMTDLVHSLADTLDSPLFMVKGVLAIVLVCLLCGTVGALVVGNRMAFFSDAMAHSAFAGVALGYLSAIAAGAGQDDATVAWMVPLVMVLFGAAVGAAIVYVREQTGLANDTVIGVFFALAIGFGAMLFRLLQEKSRFNPETFLFGSLVFVPEVDLVYLLVLVVVVGVLFARRYNDLVFASFSPSLARTRRIGMRANNYLFIILLALVVNLSIKAVGALLINALLVVPAAAAANVSQNLRQMFWLTLAICLASGLIGFFLSVYTSFGGVKFGPSGTIVVVSVAFFFASILASGLKNRAARAARPLFPAAGPGQ
jgi:zinc transport system permease protein